MYRGQHGGRTCSCRPCLLLPNPSSTNPFPAPSIESGRTKVVVAGAVDHVENDEDDQILSDLMDDIRDTIAYFSVV